MSDQDKIDELVAALREAREDADYYSGYAGEYLCEKWDVAGDLARYDAILAKYQSSSPGDASGETGGSTPAADGSVARSTPLPQAARATDPTNKGDDHAA